MPSPAQPSNERFTWTDYQHWPEEERWEIIGGQPFAMSPSPGSRHQLIATRLGAALEPHFRGKPCQLFAAPMDVRLSDEDVVQPDLLVVCDAKQIKPTHIEGPPRLVVEILSPGSEQRDRHEKRALYTRFGVAEFWIVTPFPHLVEVYALKEGRYTYWNTFTARDRLTSPTFKKVEIDLAPIFDFPLEDHEKALFRVKEPPGRYMAASERQGK